MPKLIVTLNDQAFQVELEPLSEPGKEIAARVDDTHARVRIPQHDGAALPEWLSIDDHPYELRFQRARGTVTAHGQSYRVHVQNAEMPTTHPFGSDGRVKAPIPGVITQVLVQVGQHVSAGDTLLILEAMKMENQIRAPRSGNVSALNVNVGSGVTLGEMLAEIS